MTPCDQVRSFMLYATQIGARLLRMQVGLGWVGSKVQKIERPGRYNLDLPAGAVIIYDARPFKAGVEGMSDMGGWVSVTVTPAMVGQKIAIALYVEAKSGKARPTKEQARFIEAVLQAGGRAGVAYSVQDVARIVRGE